MADVVETKVIERVERHGRSSFGNPSFKVFFTDGTKAITQENSGWAYEAPNADNIGVPLECHFTPRLKYLKFARKATTT